MKGRFDCLETVKSHLTPLKIKVLHNAIEEPFCVNGSIKNLFNIWRTFLFHKRFFVAKEGSSDYKKQERDGSLKNLLNGSLWKWFFYGIA